MQGESCWHKLMQPCKLTCGLPLSLLACTTSKQLVLPGCVKRQASCANSSSWYDNFDSAWNPVPGKEISMESAHTYGEKPVVDAGHQRIMLTSA